MELANADVARERKLMLEKEEWERERDVLLKKLDETGSIIDEKSRLLQAAQKEKLEFLSATDIIQKDAYC